MLIKSAIMVVLVVALMSASLSLADAQAKTLPPIYKAVVQGEKLYVKSRAGALAVVDLKNEQVQLLSIPVELRSDIWDAWDMVDEKVAFVRSIDLVGDIRAGKYIVELSALTPFDRDNPLRMSAVDIRKWASPGRTIGGVGMFFDDAVMGPEQPSVDDPVFLDLFHDGKQNRHTHAAGWKQTVYVTVDAYEGKKRNELLNFPNQLPKSLAPFIALPRPEGVLLIETGNGREVEVGPKTFKEVSPPQKPGDNPEDTAKEAYAVIVVDKRAPAEAILRCTVSRDGKKVVALPRPDTSTVPRPADADVLTRALTRAAEALVKAGGM